MPLLPLLDVAVPELVVEPEPEWVCEPVPPDCELVLLVGSDCVGLGAVLPLCCVPEELEFDPPPVPFPDCVGTVVGVITGFCWFVGCCCGFCWFVGCC